MPNTESRYFYIGDSRVGGDAPPFIIAEAGINHNGDLRIAKEMIRVAKHAGADAIKFQTFKAEEFCLDPDQLFTYTSQEKSVTEPMVEMFKRYEFSQEDWYELSEFSKTQDIDFLSTPQNVGDMELLVRIGVPAIKVGSDDLTNTPLIAEYSSKGLPLVLSTGMSNLDEIYRALDAANWFSGSDVAVMICTSLYPTPIDEAGIGRVRTLQEAFPGLIVGFSDHTESNLSAAIARALGASIFEKHFTLDRRSEGPDHWFSPSPSELGEWIAEIRQVDSIVGDYQLRMRPGEAANKREFQRVIVASKRIFNGDALEFSNVTMGRVSGGKGLQPNLLEMVIGRRAKRDYSRGEAIEL